MHICDGVHTVTAESQMPAWDQRNSVATCDEANLAHVMMLPDAAAAVTVDVAVNYGVEVMTGS